MSQPASWQRVFSTMVDYGYHFRWVIMPVPDGLFATKTGVGRFPSTQALQAQVAEGPPWDKEIPIHEERMLPKPAYHSVEHRLTMVGNIVVPYQGQLAFLFLSSRPQC